MAWSQQQGTLFMRSFMEKCTTKGNVIGSCDLFGYLLRPLLLSTHPSLDFPLCSSMEKSLRRFEQAADCLKEYYNQKVRHDFDTIQ
ncbi:hypothetical protein MUK42_33513 [Musa troglodytarum]|uniref:Uncharacterized protein n=1 Tax=Musa troglodytarum TaxID=320322 RepID=A0A9E7JUL4_9LILI|nr:hypothetical protein MUK42_33513 [Musa troglodytarum]